MFDRRVIRGNTYARHRLPKFQQEANALERRQGRRRQKPKKLQEEEGIELRDEGPPAVDGRVHMEIQTEALLEVLMDKPEEADIGVQTEDMMNR